MSIKVMAEVWALNLPSDEKFILVALGDFANDFGICFPSLPHVAWKCGFSESTTRRIMHRLIQIELLEPRGNTKGGRSRPVTYRIHPEKGVKLTPFKPCQADTLSHCDDVTKGVKSDEKGVTAVTPDPSVDLYRKSGMSSASSPSTASNSSSGLTKTTAHTTLNQNYNPLKDPRLSDEIRRISEILSMPK